MPDLQGLDLPIAGLVSILLIKEVFALVRGMLNGKSGHGAATKLDLEHAKAQILVEVRTSQDAIHQRVTDISTRLARVEGRG